MESWFRAQPKPNDIIFVNKGTPGRVCLVPDPVPFCFAQDMIGFRCDSNKIDFEYLFAVLRSDYIQKTIENFHVGLVIPHFKKGDLDNLKIPRLGSRNQEFLVGKLYLSLSKKIELNNRINAELEAMAKTLYDYWFVQFDFPDVNGKPYKTAGGKMVYNPTLKREIPDGWTNMLIQDCADLFRGVTYGKDDVLPNNNSGIGVLRATNITGNQIDMDELVYVAEDLVSENQILNKFETLIVMSSGSTEHIGKNGIYYFDDKCAFGAFCSKLEIHKEYTFYLSTFLNTVWFKTYIKNQCLGTNINNLTNEHIKKCALVKPDSTTLKNFDIQAKPLYEKIAVNCQENVQLKKLRDWLLPMLMNGQVTVK